MTDDRPAQELDYARPSRPRLPWKKCLRAAALIVLLAALGWIVAKLADNAAALRRQSQVAQFTFPPESPVYTDDPDQVQRLLAAGNGYRRGERSLLHRLAPSRVISALFALFAFVFE
jgi:hypothetical protein